MKEFVGLRAKKYSYLKDNNNEDNRAKDTKKRVITRKLKFRDYKNCLEAAQIEIKIIYLNQKELIKNNKLILKTQQRFRSESIMFLLKKLTRLL